VSEVPSERLASCSCASNKRINLTLTVGNDDYERLRDNIEMNRGSDLRLGGVTMRWGRGCC